MNFNKNLLFFTTPGFHEDSIDFEQFVRYYLAHNCRVDIFNKKEIDLLYNITKYVIEASYGYDDSEFLKTPHGRAQVIFNSVLQEIIIEHYLGYIKRSSAIWSLTSEAESGTDFITDDGIKIEAKVYKDINSMTKFANKASENSSVFHKADYVLCYLIESHDGKHWHWLKNNAGIYSTDNIEQRFIDDLNKLPKDIKICYCTAKSNSIIFAKNQFCK